MARNNHGVPPVTWDAALAGGALQWAILQGSAGTANHEAGPYGENLGGYDFSQEYTPVPEDMVYEWYVFPLCYIKIMNYVIIYNITQLTMYVSDNTCDT